VKKGRCNDASAYAPVLLAFYFTDPVDGYEDQMFSVKLYPGTEGTKEGGKGSGIVSSRMNATLGVPRTYPLAMN